MLLPILILTHCFSPECNSVSGSVLHDNILLTFFIFWPVVQGTALSVSCHFVSATWCTCMVALFFTICNTSLTHTENIFSSCRIDTIELSSYRQGVLFSYVNYTAPSGIASVLIFHTLQPPVVTTLHNYWKVSYVLFCLLDHCIFMSILFPAISTQ